MEIDECRETTRLGVFSKIGRGERIRTSGLYVPNVALYQAKLHPVFDDRPRVF